MAIEKALFWLLILQSAVKRGLLLYDNRDASLETQDLRFAAHLIGSDRNGQNIKPIRTDKRA